MIGPTVDISGVTDSQHNTQNSEWTCVSGFNKIPDTVARQTSPFFGHAASAVVSDAILPPSLAVDPAYAIKPLHDRKIAKPQTMTQNQIPGNGAQTPVQNQLPSSGLRIPATNLPVIPEAKVQWQRYIHDDDVRTTMERYDRFLADNALHHPEEIPKEAYRQLEKARGGDIPMELITPDSVTTIKLLEELGGGGSKTFYDIGNGQALALIQAPHQFYDELMMLRYLEKLGIPTNEIKPAVIGWKFEGVTYTIATYIAPSFSAYANQNAFVLDRKNYRETVERLNNKKVLPADQNPFSLEHWDEVLNPLVKDIRTLIDNGVSTLGDSLNAILVGKGTQFHSGGPADYEARAFPFDFSDKYDQYDQLPVKKRLTTEEERKTLKDYIEQVVFVQFNAAAIFLPGKWKDLVDRLTERYLRQGAKPPGNSA
ncbi:hypothetical protein [Endozoicomonas sp. SCSIO W0465]|uniref:hypothetical protein n=1 Tax=Endozoicomonas sp. SCSIO W0465 TaxID=2918516 RepID=UPI0020762A3D|nr:hypothetical protein [Endozoicomonas sp. SCSIO W0465]USE35045.1 hypothetical protein MJO57_23465 [Endozoicomonas sp. SCSIO W0465]